ncbi:MULTISPECIES: hypothetical protein [Oscillatoriales]|uniref:hypothetical protein n=1 Tax=Oscillatoriophycideae TaxID=1301283 RepID=UPI00168793BD|nr:MULTISPECIES: hypothetical protein [Oscillatoriales]
MYRPWQGEAWRSPAEGKFVGVDRLSPKSSCLRQTVRSPRRNTYVHLFVNSFTATGALDDNESLAVS